MIIALNVVDRKTNKVVKTIKLQPSISRNHKMVEKTLAGLLRNMNTERYRVDEVDDGKSISRGKFGPRGQDEDWQDDS